MKGAKDGRDAWPERPRELRVRELTVRLKGRTLLDEVSLSVASGRVFGLIGPNGAGKSTLLRCMAGLLPSAAARVFLDDRPLASLPADRLARSVSYLPQREEIYWPMSVEKIVSLARLAHRGPFGAASPRDGCAVEEAIQTAGVAAIRHRSVAELSGGECMRTLLARLLAVEADFLLADEPVSGLDPRHQLQFLQLFREQAAGGRAAVLVLHDLVLAARFCDRLLLLDQGRVLACGAPVEVLQERLLRRVYGVEVMRGRHAGEDFVLPWTPAEAEG